MRPDELTGGVRVDGRKETAKTPYKGTYKAHDTLGKYLPCISQQRISMLATDRILLNAQDTPQENWAKDTNRRFSQEIRTAVKHTTHHCVSFIIRQMQTRRIMRAYFHQSDWSKQKKHDDGLVCGIWAKRLSVHRQ